MHAQNLRTWVLLAGFILCLAALPGSLRAANAYVVRNLTSDIPDLADHTDPNLKGACGISESSKSPFSISDAGSELSTLYNSARGVVPLVVTIPPSKASGTSLCQPRTA